MFTAYSFPFLSGFSYNHLFSYLTGSYLRIERTESYIPGVFIWTFLMFIQKGISLPNVCKEYPVHFACLKGDYHRTILRIWKWWVPSNVSPITRYYINRENILLYQTNHLAIIKIAAFGFLAVPLSYRYSCLNCNRNQCVWVNNVQFANILRNAAEWSNTWLIIFIDPIV